MVPREVGLLTGESVGTLKSFASGTHFGGWLIRERDCDGHTGLAADVDVAPELLYQRAHQTKAERAFAHAGHADPVVLDHKRDPARLRAHVAV